MRRSWDSVQTEISRLSRMAIVLNLIPILDTFQALCRQSESVTRWRRLVCLHAASPKSLHVFRVCTDPRGYAVLRRGSAAAPLLRLRVRIPPGEWKSVSCECCVLSGTGLCVGLITRPVDSYRVWCICDRDTQIMRRPWPTRGRYTRKKKFEHVIILVSVIVFGTRSILQSRMFKFVWNLRLFRAPLRI